MTERVQKYGATRVCSDCGCTLPIESFDQVSTIKKYRSRRCIDCRRKAKAQWYVNTKEKRIRSSMSLGRDQYRVLMSVLDTAQADGIADVRRIVKAAAERAGVE